MQTQTFYTPEQVAEIVQLHVQTIISLIKKQELSAIKFGRKWRISQEHLDQYTIRRTMKAKKQTV